MGGREEQTATPPACPLKVVRINQQLLMSQPVTSVFMKERVSDPTEVHNYRCRRAQGHKWPIWVDPHTFKVWPATTETATCSVVHPRWSHALQLNQRTRLVW